MQLKVEVRALGWRTLYTTMLTHLPWTQSVVRDKIFLAELFRVGIVHACHTSDIVGVPAAPGRHFKARIMLPIIHSSGLSVISCPAIPNCSWIVSIGAPFWRIGHTTLLSHRWTTQLGVLVAVKVTEVIRMDLLHASRTLQGFPKAADNVVINARMSCPLNGGVELSVVSSEAVSHCDGILNKATDLGHGIHAAAVLPCEAELRVGRRVLRGTVLLGEDTCRAGSAGHVLLKPTTTYMTFLTDTPVFTPTVCGSNFTVIKSETISNYSVHQNIAAVIGWRGRTARSHVNFRATWDRIALTELFNCNTCCASETVS